MRSPVILRVFKDNQLVEVKQFDKEQIIFGHGGDVDVDLADAAVSPIHCLIELRDSGYYVADLGSSTGTLKKGAAVLDEALSSGDQIGIGPFVVHFFVGVPKPKAPPAGVVQTPAATPVSSVPAAKPTATPVAPTPIPVVPPASSAPVPPPASIPVAPPVKPVASIPEAPKPKTMPTEKSRPQLPETGRVERSSSGKSAKAARKSRSTFSPSSEITDLRSYLKPTKGAVVEILVAWKERILSSHHFTNQKSVSIGPKGCDITIPSTFLSQKMKFADLSQGTKIYLAGSMQPEIHQAEKQYDADMMNSLGKATRGSGGLEVRVDQGELLSISVGDGTLQIFVRHVPATATPTLLGFDLTAGELTGLIVSFVIVALLALYVSVYTPGDQPPDKQEDQLHLATFVYTKKDIPPPQPLPTPPPPKPVEPPPKTPPQKVEVVKNAQDTKGDPKKKSAAMRDKPARAEEVRANNSKSTRKTFTSAVKQGGAVKTSDQASANAASKKDVNDMGLLSAFGAGGNKKSLDKAYNGAGELLGDASKATGSSGFNKDRAGDDLGGQFKDTGAGGKGTATQGIAGIKTSGRSSGQNSYGNIGVGGKGSVAIEVGGAGEAFVGTVDREQVRRVVRSIKAQLQSCFERGLVTNSGLEGKVVIHWEVVEQGHVKLSNVKEAPEDMQEVAKCMALRLKEQRFPEPPGGSYYEVDFPFVMSKQN